MRRTILFGASLLALVATACGPKAEEAPPAQTQVAPPPPPAPPARRMEIVSPAEGETVPGPNVSVKLAGFGFSVVPAGDTTPNSGHFHVFLDRAVSAAGAPIPAEAGFIVHMGKGTDTLTIANVAAGPHTLIGVVGDAKHIPDLTLEDTVHFVVK